MNDETYVKLNFKTIPGHYFLYGSLHEKGEG